MDTIKMPTDDDNRKAAALIHGLHPAKREDVEALIEAAKERDGGTHDTDCGHRLGRGYLCRCGHEALLDALAQVEGE